MPEFSDIPGVRADVVDFGTRVSPPPVGQKVIILGVTDAADVELEEPILINRFEDRYQFNLSTGVPSELVKMIEEVMSAGAKNVEVMVNSDASGNRYAESAVTPATRYSMLDRAYELLIHHDADIVVACGTAVDMTGLSSGQSFAYQMANYCYQSTKEYNSCIGVIGVQPPTAGVATTGNLSLAALKSHVDALKIFDTSGLLGIDFPEFDGVTDTIPAPSGDGKPDTFAFWATTDENMPTGSPPYDAANVVLDVKDDPIDIGGYISVVSTWCRYRNSAAQRLYPTVGYYNACGVGSYAGMIPRLPPQVATTNQVVPGAEPLRTPSAVQVNELCGARYVTFWTRPKGFVVASGVTGAHNIDDYHKSDFVRLSTMRITQEVVAMIRLAADPFIGQPNNAETRSALENAIDRALGKEQNEGALEGFEFSLLSTPTMRVLGQVIVDCKIVPAFEITDIRVKVGLSAA